MPTALIIGAGANIGFATAAQFKNAGYKVAIASRSTPSDTTYEHFVFDAGEPAKVPDLFARVSAKLGLPSVVIYNAATRNPAPPEDPLNVELDSFTKDMNTNVTSVFMSAREAIRSFDTLRIESGGGTFIFTGNKLNVYDLPGMLVFGTGKAAAAKIIQSASHGYKGKGYKFYYADERLRDGNHAGLDRDGAAHAALYLELAQDNNQRPWLQTFVKGTGYVDFEEKHGL